jgi:hypothetical protein
MWRRRRGDPPLDTEQEMPVSRWETCPNCGSARHVKVIEEQPDGEALASRGCLVCATVWPEQTQPHRPPTHGQPIGIDSTNPLHDNSKGSAP